MSQTISGNLTVVGSTTLNGLVCSSGNINTLQTNTLNVTNLNGSINSLTIPTLTSTNITNSSTIRSQEMFIGPKNIGTSVQTLEDNNVIDKNNILTLQTKTTNISYNSTNLQTSISGDTNISNINNYVKITNPGNGVHVLFKPGYSTNTVQQAGNVYVGTAFTTDTINVNCNLDVSQTVKASTLNSNNAIINNIDFNNYVSTNNININNYGSRITTLETNQNNNNLNMTGLSYNSTYDKTTIDNDVVVTKLIDCKALSVNVELTYDSTAISNVKTPHGLVLGTGDGNTYTNFNLGISSWNSTGFIDSAGKKCNMVVDHRTGDIKTLGNVNCNGITATGNLSCNILSCAGIISNSAIPCWLMNTPLQSPRFDRLVPLLASTKNLGTTNDPEFAIDVDDLFIVNPGYYIQLFDSINYRNSLGAIDNRTGTTPKVVSSVSVYNAENRVASVKIYNNVGVEITLPLFS